MKRIIRLNKKFISLFLVVMMIWSMAFTGIKVSAATGLTISVNDSSNQSIDKYTNSGGKENSNKIFSTPVRLAADATAKISYDFTNATSAKYQFVKASDLNTVPQFPQDLTMININLPAPNSYDAYKNDIGAQGTISTMQYVYAGNPATANGTAQLPRDNSFSTPLSSTMLVQNAIVSSDIPSYTVSGSNAFLSNQTLYSNKTTTDKAVRDSTYYVWNKYNNCYCRPIKNASWKAMKFWGYFAPQQTGYYNLGAYSDDGAYGYIIKDGQPQVFVNDWSIASANNRTSNNVIKLDSGSYYPIYMEWYEGNPTMGAFTPVYQFSSTSSTSALSKSWANIPQNYFYSSKTTTPGTIPGAYFGDVSGIPFPNEDGIYYIATKFISGEGTTSGLYGPFIIDKTSPTISNLSVVSNNSSSNKKAVAGNTLTINFTASEALQGNPQILINGYVANATYTNISGNNYTATVNIGNDASIDSSGDKITNGPINVQIANYSDLSGNLGSSVQDNSVTFSSNNLGITLELTKNPTTLTNGNVAVTAKATAFNSGNRITTMKYASGSQSVNYFTAGGTNLTISQLTSSNNSNGVLQSPAQSAFNVSNNGFYTVYTTDSSGNVAVQTINVSNIDTEPPTLTLTPSTTNPTSGTVTITAAASDNVAVASITNPDESIVEFNPAIQNNSTTYIVSANGTYTFKAADTAGNVTTQSIPITNINRTGLSNQSIINSTNTQRITPSRVNLGQTFDVNYTINFNNQTLDDSKPNRQQWLACVKDNSNNMNYQMIDDVLASSGTSRASVRDGINFKLNKNNIKCNESYYFSNDSSSNSLSSRMNDALTAVTQKNSQGHERDIVIMIGTNISNSELQNAIAVANNIKNHSDDYKLGINSIVINIGNKAGEENIKKLAGALGGNYIFLNNADEASKINDNYISQLAANISDNYPLQNIYFEDTYSDNFEAVNAPNFITIDNVNRKIDGSFYANYYIQDGQIKCDAVNFTVTYRAVSYKDSSYIGAGVFNVINNTTDQKILERVPIQVIVPDTTPPTITLTPSTTEQTKNNITVTANVTDNVGVTVTKWASGNQNSDYFASNGTNLNGNTFIVTENGTYTVYATDAAGNESVRTIRIDNIDREPPQIILTPSTTQLTKGNIIVTADVTDNVEVAITKWASGNQTADYFASNGTVLSGSTFTVSENGIYTVYAKDTAGNTNTETITIDNIKKLEANLILKKELNGDAFVGTKFEIKYTITPNEIAAYPNDVNPQEIVVSNLTFTEYLPDGLILDQSQIDQNKLNVTLNGNTLSGNIVPTIRYTLDSTGTKYTAQPISFSIWVSSNSINTYTMSGENSYINYSDIGNSTKKSNFNDLSIVVNGHSSILSHGIYSGKDSSIETSNNVVAGIPVTLAMKLDVKSSNPIINWKRDNTISEGTIVFKKYLLKDNGEIDTAESVQTLSFNNTGNINLTGLTTVIGKKYLITYTITPVSTGTITTTATADTTSSVPVNLNVGARPDLF